MTRDGLMPCDVLLQCDGLMKCDVIIIFDGVMAHECHVMDKMSFESHHMTFE